jgi:hypothetical protein
LDDFCGDGTPLILQLLQIGTIVEEILESHVIECMVDLFYSACEIVVVVVVVVVFLELRATAENGEIDRQVL